MTLLHQAAQQAVEVPLLEQLRSVPANAKLHIDTPNALGCMDTRSIPVGRLCHEAAAALQQQPEPVADAFDRGDVEAVAACLGDDAAQIRREQEDMEAGRVVVACEEWADNMDRAASMLTWMLLTHPLYASPAIQQPYKDSTPDLHVGNASFESWYGSSLFDGRYLTGHNKQDMRDSYAAGMGDPLVMARPALHHPLESRALNTTPVVDQNEADVRDKGALQQEAGSGWKPIESAPKDGREVILRTASQRRSPMAENTAGVKGDANA